MNTYKVVLIDSVNVTVNAVSYGIAANGVLIFTDADGDIIAFSAGAWSSVTTKEAQVEWPDATGLKA